MTKDTSRQLWKPRSLDDTLQLYADWADSYESDVKDWGYVTPTRIAQALAREMDDLTVPVLDFGCGTGLSGVALREEGFASVDGTDISQEMINRIEGREIYRKAWLSPPGELDATPGAYGAIVAAGVISAGAAPAETMDMVLDRLGRGCFLAFSYNDATMDTASYTDKLAEVQADGRAELIFSEHGDHLPGRDMSSMVYILRRL